MRKNAFGAEKRLICSLTIYDLGHTFKQGGDLITVSFYAQGATCLESRLSLTNGIE